MAGAPSRKIHALEEITKCTSCLARALFPRDFWLSDAGVKSSFPAHGALPPTPHPHPHPPPTTHGCIAVYRSHCMGHTWTSLRTTLPVSKDAITVNSKNLPFTRWTDKQIMAYPYNGMLLSVKQTNKQNQLLIHMTTRMGLIDVTLNKRSHTVRTAGSHVHEILQQAKLISRDGIRPISGGWQVEGV